MCLPIDYPVMSTKLIIVPFQAGGGIVYDSDPTAEYEETMNKMRANDKALREAEKYFSDLITQNQAAAH
jgi:anthranilate synthase component 1